MTSRAFQHCALQVSCLGKVREWHLSLSLYKLTAFVTFSITELSTLEPLPIYPFHWTTDLQSTACTQSYQTFFLTEVEGI